VGDLEEVLGDIVEELYQTALDPTLTPNQAEEKARQTADNAIRLVEERERLERESKSLLGLDEGFMDELERMRAKGKIVSPDELRLMIEGFLGQPRLDGRLTPDDRLASTYRLRLRKEPRSELHADIRATRRNDRQTTEFLRWLIGSEPYLTVTFDQEVALEHRGIPFITPVHPLAKMAVEYWQGMTEPLTGGLRFNDPSMPPGRYIFICDLWQTVAVNPEVRLMCLVYDLDQRKVSEPLSEGLLRLLSAPLEALATTDGDGITEGLKALDEESHNRRLEELQSLREGNELLVAQRLASLDAYSKNRLQRVQDELAASTNERISRMKQAERNRIWADYTKKRQAIESHREADIIGNRLAVGLLEVCHA